MTHEQQKNVIGVCIVIGALVLSAILYAMQSGGAPRAGTRSGGGMPVVTSFYPLQFVAERVGGAAVAVTNVVPAGAEPHDYEPSARDLAAIEDAKVVLLLGGVEPWAHDIDRVVDPSRTSLLLLGSGLQNLRGEEDGHGHEEEEDEEEGEALDPHVWLDPKLMASMADRAAEAFAAADAANAEAYRANAAALKAELASLDVSFRDGLAACRKKEFVTSHAAFAYLAHAYGLEQVPISGLSPDIEPTPRDLAAVADFVREHGVGIIFFESLVSPKLSQTIAAETGAKTMELNPLEGLTEEQIAAGADYLSVMRDNLNNLSEALQCRT